MQVGMVIQILDAVTDGPLEASGIRPEISMTSGTSPFYKGNGYYLFFHPLEPEAVFTIHAYGYRSVQGRLSDIAATEGSCKIYMQPDSRYPLSTEIYGIQGMAEPGTTLLLVCRESEGKSRLTENYEAGTDIISFSARAGAAGMEYQIQEQEQTEFFKIAEIMDRETGQYRLAAPLLHSYQKGETVLFPVKRIPVDASGEFVWYLQRKKGNKAVLHCELWKQDEMTWKELELRAGTRLSIGRIG